MFIIPVSSAVTIFTGHIEGAVQCGKVAAQVVPEGVCGLLTTRLFKKFIRAYQHNFAVGYAKVLRAY